MGLYLDLQNDIKEALNSDLLDAYKTIEVTSFTSGVYDPALGTLISTEITSTCKCVVIKDQDGDNIDSPESVEGLVLMVMDSDKPFSFANGQKILYSSNYYKVKGIKTDPIEAEWQLSCIKWN